MRAQNDTRRTRETAEEPERMAVGPERAEDLREASRQGGEADANFGLIVGIGLLVYALWVLIGKRV
jgi:hypothetical protein